VVLYELLTGERLFKGDEAADTLAQVLTQDWLQISTTQGQTAGTVVVTANPAGLASGIYDGSVLFTPTESGINQVAVPVTLIVDCGQGGCVLQPNILAVVNGASFQPGGAPRAINN
jgi:adhesin/invasin